MRTWFIIVRPSGSQSLPVPPATGNYEGGGDVNSAESGNLSSSHSTPLVEDVTMEESHGCSTESHRPDTSRRAVIPSTAYRRSFKPHLKVIIKNKSFARRICANKLVAEKELSKCKFPKFVSRLNQDSRGNVNIYFDAPRDELTAMFAVICGNWNTEWFGGDSRVVTPVCPSERVEVLIRDSCVSRPRSDFLDWFKSRGIWPVGMVRRQRFNGRPTRSVRAEVPAEHEQFLYSNGMNLGAVLLRVFPAEKRSLRNPVRCLKCQKWGHNLSFCPSTHPVCSFCAGSHRASQCSKRMSNTNPCCANCKRSSRSHNHPAYSRNCPVFVSRRRSLNGILIRGRVADAGLPVRRHDSQPIAASRVDSRSWSSVVDSGAHISGQSPVVARSAQRVSSVPARPVDAAVVSLSQAIVSLTSAFSLLVKSLADPSSLSANIEHIQSHLSRATSSAQLNLPAASQLAIPHSQVPLPDDGSDVMVESPEAKLSEPLSTPGGPVSQLSNPISAVDPDVRRGKRRRTERDAPDVLRTRSQTRAAGIILDGNGRPLNSNPL